MFCLNCTKIVEIRREQGQDYYNDICSQCQIALKDSIIQNLLALIGKGSP